MPDEIIRGYNCHDNVAYHITSHSAKRNTGVLLTILSTKLLMLRIIILPKICIITK